MCVALFSMPVCSVYLTINKHDRSPIVYVKFRALFHYFFFLICLSIYRSDEWRLNSKAESLMDQLLFCFSSARCLLNVNCSSDWCTLKQHTDFILEPCFSLYQLITNQAQSQSQNLNIAMIHPGKCKIKRNV